jgi:DNA-binding response OmpR family regulator
MKVLVVDDDAELLDLMSYALRREGYSVLGAADGKQAISRWQEAKPDIVLLDGRLPRLNGFEVCRRIRHESKVPVIMLTALDDEDDIVRGLDMGADDYLVKPFSVKQLTARMRAVLRRTSADGKRLPANEFRVGDIVLDVDAHQVTRSGHEIHLTLLEFRILHMLMMYPGRVLPYARLIEHVWGYHGQESSGLLKTHISHLRQKLGMPEDAPGGIRSILGVGYCLERPN